MVGGRGRGNDRIRGHVGRPADAGIHLTAGRRYRITGTSDNPTGRTIRDGVMAHLIYLFTADRGAGSKMGDQTGPLMRRSPMSRRQCFVSSNEDCD